MAERPKASACGRSLAGIAGLNPAADMEECVLWVLLGRGLCERPIPRPEEFYRLWCVSMNVIRKTLTRGRTGPRKLLSCDKKSKNYSSVLFFWYIKFQSQDILLKLYVSVSASALFR